MNNGEGEISVGSRVPFPVSTIGLGGGVPGAGAGALGALGGLGGLGGFFPQVQREKVALEMKLTPHVNEHDIIRLEVDEKISELAPGSSNLGPSTSERTAKTIVVAKDQQSEEHTSELQSHLNLVCRLLLEKKKRAGAALPLDTVSAASARRSSASSRCCATTPAYR